MELDNKQKVLLAIYTEYQKDIPLMRNEIKADNIGIDRDTLYMALVKLDNERYITNIKPIYGGSNRVPIDIIIDHMMITRDGIEYVEQKLSINSKLSNKEKVESVIKNTGEWGFDQLKDFGAKVLAEIIKSPG